MITPFILLFLILECVAINVLVLSPAFGGSHMNFMARLADTLTEAGHNVTFLVAVADETRKNQLGVKLTKDVVVVERDEQMISEHVEFESDLAGLWTLDSHNADFDGMLSWYNVLIEAYCANFVRNREVFSDMKSRNFDVAILEPVTICGLGYFKKLGIEKTILASSQTAYDFVVANSGEPQELSYVPASQSPFTDKMTMTERYTNYVFSRGNRGNIERMFDKETETYKKYLGEDIPDWRELMPAASLMFTNSNPYVDFPRPVLQKTVPIGGISVDLESIRSQKLNAEWDEILERKERNMLISFGSMVRSSEMPVEWKMNLLEVIRSEPNVTFIWKYETDETAFAAGVDNIHFSKWVPQTALLNDPRLSAFLTHGGLGSTMELAHCGKPAVMVPITFDQFRNAHMLQRHHSVIRVWKTDLGNFEIVKSAVHSILYDKNYQRNATILADLLENQPYSPKEQLVKHTEFVAKYGPFPQLDPFGRQLNAFQKSFLDIFLVAFLVSFVSLLFIYLLLKDLITRIVSIRLARSVKNKTI